MWPRASGERLWGARPWVWTEWKAPSRRIGWCGAISRATISTVALAGRETAECAGTDNLSNWMRQLHLSRLTRARPGRGGVHFEALIADLEHRGTRRLWVRLRAEPARRVVHLDHPQIRRKSMPHVYVAATHSLTSQGGSGICQSTAPIAIASCHGESTHPAPVPGVPVLRFSRNPPELEPICPSSHHPR